MYAIQGRVHLATGNALKARRVGALNVGISTKHIILAAWIQTSSTVEGAGWLTPVTCVRRGAVVSVSSVKINGMESVQSAGALA